jgi:hypothetical protein
VTAPRLARLTSIELQGYKTFAARTEFRFSPTITAIVGPNSSGKSEHCRLDRWVLGEQTTHSRRKKTKHDLRQFGGRQVTWRRYHHLRQQRRLAAVEFGSDRQPAPIATGNSTSSTGNVRLRVTEIWRSAGWRSAHDHRAGLVDAALSLRPKNAGCCSKPPASGCIAPPRRPAPSGAPAQPGRAQDIWRR